MIEQKKDPEGGGVVDSKLTQIVLVALLGWGVVSIGFLGLNMLMKERPQFVGQPGSGPQVKLVQQSPRLLMRKASDDVAMVTEAQPLSADIRFDMAGRRDYRGLRTLMDMAGTVRGRYVVSNVFSEGVFVLFRCPHPSAEGRMGSGGHVGGLDLESSISGLLETEGDAWVWSGELAGGESVDLTFDYEVSNLLEARYEISANSIKPISPHRVSFHHGDLPGMVFESAEGRATSEGSVVVWDRSDFLPPDYFSGRIVTTRNLFSSLTQLLDIGPLLSFLFLVTALAGIGVGRLKPLQVLTILAGFGLYFPLLVYLSAKFSFPLALIAALTVPGVLILNFARWLVGIRLGLIGGAILLAIYQVFPTLAAFSGWNRGLVLLCLGVVTLFVLIHRQNQSLRRQAMGVGLVLLFLSVGVGRAQVSEAQVLLPARLIDPVTEAQRPPQVSIGTTRYTVTANSRYLEVTAVIPFETYEGATGSVSLFKEPIHLVKSDVPPLVKLSSDTNGIAAWGVAAGKGVISVVFRAPVDYEEGRSVVRLPMVAAGAGSLQVDLFHENLVATGGSVWSVEKVESGFRYSLGVTGGNPLTLSYGGRESDGTVADGGAAEAAGIYGIKVAHARHLTVVDSSGGVTHFSEFELPSFHKDSFVVGLAEGVRVISVSVDGIELTSPQVLDGRVSIPVGASGSHRRKVSLRLAYSPVRIGFVGRVTFGLPEHFSTVGRVEWSVVLPDGFDLELLSGGLEVNRGKVDLGSFGDYGRVLKVNPRLSLSRNLVSPGRIEAQILYRQRVFEQAGAAQVE